MLPGLHFGGKSAAGAVELVDEVHRHTGCAATVFVRNEQDFVRVVTSVKRADGKRAKGTLLNPRGMAIQHAQTGSALPESGLCAGQTVYVLGKSFYAVYEPVLDASGEVLGALYAGRPVG